MYVRCRARVPRYGKLSHMTPPSRRRTLLAHFEQLTVSVDGLRPFHDHVRGQPGLFDQLRHNMAALRREDSNQRVWRRVNIVLMRDNIEHFADFAAEMADWGFHELTFNQLGGVERPEFFARHRDKGRVRYANAPLASTEISSAGIRRVGANYFAPAGSNVGLTLRSVTRSRTPTSSRIARVPASPSRGLANRMIRV